MALTAGTKLGQYVVTSAIGAGGMGEVYQAHDTKLGRDVAIKVLPEAFAHDPERLSRFQREAKMLAALNHPNIATIYGLEQSNGTSYLVMELVSGETLADRVKREGAVPIEEALAIAKQIVEALEAAHEKGIVHRDLKPANVKVTPEGKVKVLDFGLAKAFAGDGANEDPSNSPTLSRAATMQGVILGTAAYMSPEQARGKSVDKRTDIWAFGCVLYELLTGKQAFEGEDIAEILAAVVKTEPDLDKAPPQARRLLGQCLEKDPKKRLRDIGDTMPLLDFVHVAVQQTAPAPRDWMWPGVAAVMALIALGTAGYFAARPAPAALVSRFTVESPPETSFTNLFAAAAISPDGRYLVFGAAQGTNTPSLWLRPLDSLAARQLPGTEGANFPFWSSDSKSIAFTADGKLRRLDLAGGAPLVLCDLPPQNNAAVGGAWSRNGIILLGGSDGLWRVPANGGAPVPVTKADGTHQETGHGYPQFLPDGKHFLYFLQSSDANAQGTYAASLDRPKDRALILRSSFKVVYTTPLAGRTGYLLSLRDGTLFAQAFDAEKLRLAGDPTPIAEDVPVNLLQRAAYWISDAGVLMYRSGQTTNKNKLVWMSRDGKRLEQAAAEDYFTEFKLSPNGKKVALGVEQQGAGTNENISVLDLTRSVTTRLTFGSTIDHYPVWSPDGSQIAFTSLRNGTDQVYRKDAAGAGQEEQLTDDRNLNKSTSDWSRDGKYLIYSETGPETDLDIWALPLAAGNNDDGKPLAILQTSHAEMNGQLSPDGRWLAYASNESGQYEVYMRAFPGASSGAGGKWQISNQGGRMPRWRGDGKELFYVNGVNNKVMAATIGANATSVQASTPRELFSLPTVGVGSILSFNYDVTADGQRFLVLEPVGGAQAVSAPLTVVVNWQAGLQK